MIFLYLYYFKYIRLFLFKIHNIIYFKFPYNFALCFSCTQCRWAYMLYAPLCAQSAILGMHATKMRPVVVDGKVEARPMMYLALTYDHR